MDYAGSASVIAPMSMGAMGLSGIANAAKMRSRPLADAPRHDQDDMPRSILEESRLHPAIRERAAGYHLSVVREVMDAVATNDVVVVGMRMNPFPRRARQALDAIGQAYRYLEYGSYLDDWRRRLALKMWTGWPTFPMVFVKGTLVGGASELKALIESGELRAMLGSTRSM